MAFLFFVGIGVLVMLLTDVAVPPAEMLASRTFLHLPLHVSSGLWLAWCVSAFVWLRELGAGEEKRGTPRGAALAPIVAGVVVLWGVACYIKPVLSTDVNLYVAEGRQIVVYGQSPYLLPLDATLPDPFLFQMARGWLDNTSPYGPLTLGSFALVCLLPLQSLLAYITAMKVLMTLFLAGIAAVLWKTLESDRLRLTKTAGVVANPVVIWYAIIDCHLDIMLVFFLLLGLEATRRERPCWAALGLVGACAIKIFAVLTAPLVFFWMMARSHRSATWFAASFGLLFAGMSLLTGSGDLAVLWQYPPNSMTRAAIIPSLLVGLGLPIPMALRISNLALVVFFLGLCLVLARGWFRDAPSLPVALVFIAFVSTRNYWQPWYTLEFWPLLGLLARRSGAHDLIVGSWMFCLPLYAFMTSFREVLMTAAIMFALNLTLQESGGVRATAPNP